jgi:hypothetical protein
MKWIAGLVVVIVVLTVGAYAVVEMNRPEEPAAPLPSEITTTPTPSSVAESQSPNLKCSASPLAAAHDDDMAGELPEAVAETRMAVIDAAITCDYRRLQQLALGGREGFSYSFGVEESPADFWRARERDARQQRAASSEYLRFLVQTLELPYCEEESPGGELFFIWPRVHCGARTPADWEHIRGLYPDELIDEMRTNDIFYGFRIGIVEDGDWVYFIAGD